MKNFFYYIFAIVFVFSALTTPVFAQNLLQMQLQKHLETSMQSSQKTENTNILIKENEDDVKEKRNTQKPHFTMDFSDDIEEVKVYDFFSDNSITRFVGVDNPLSDKKFIPENLTYISGEYISGEWQLRDEAKWALDALWENFFKKFAKKLQISSAYRSFFDQNYIEKTRQTCIKNGFCARAGHSEHQLGLAIDIRELFENANNKPEYKWLVENAHLYGWTQSYQKWRKIDGYQKEPWHWRYVGRELATKLKHDNITFSQFFAKNLQK